MLNIWTRDWSNNKHGVNKYNWNQTKTFYFIDMSLWLLIFDFANYITIQQTINAIIYNIVSMMHRI
jgi:hypothetical protein